MANDEVVFEVAVSCLWFVRAGLVPLLRCVNIQIVAFGKTFIKCGIGMQLSHWINLDVVSCFKGL